jgi:hypothetical protein
MLVRSRFVLGVVFLVVGPGVFVACGGSAPLTATNANGVAVMRTE